MPRVPTRLFDRRRFVKLALGGAAVVAATAALPRLFAEGGSALPLAGSIHTDPGEVLLEVYDDAGHDLGTQRLPRLVLDDAAWHQRLSPAAFAILRRGNTETAFSQQHERPAARGLYRCAGCATALYDDDTQYDSGTGWPSFWKPISAHNVIELGDASLGMQRTEIRCARCEGHLGHVFDDGPQPTGLRYCMNALALRFVARTTG